MLTTPKVKVLTLAAAATILGVGIAAAADAGPVYVPPPAPPAAPPPMDWHGFYFGIQGGGGWGSEDATFLDNECSPICAHDFNTSGPFVGAHIGADFQPMGGKLVIGAVADINWSGIDGVTNEWSDFLDSYLTTTYDVDYFGTIRGRLGFDMGSWMPYVTGGWAFGQSTRTNSSPYGGVASASLSGWTVGGGIEKMLGNGWSLSGEYKYLNFSPIVIDYPGDDCCGDFASVSVDIKVHTFQLGLSKRF